MSEMKSKPIKTVNNDMTYVNGGGKMNKVWALLFGVLTVALVVGMATACSSDWSRETSNPSAEAASTPTRVPQTSVAVAEAEGKPRGVGEIHGVIVGVSDYLYMNDLQSPDDGARQIYRQLQDLWGEEADLSLLVDEAATKTGIQETMSGLAAREDANDIVFFYYTGHGNEGYICPHDSLARSYAQDISPWLLDQWLDVLDSEKIVVIIDSCHAGAYANALAQDGRVIVASCGADETCWREFSEYLVRGLSNPADVDVNGDSRLSVEELCRYCSAQLTDQHPHLVDNFAGELVIAAVVAK